MRNVAEGSLTETVMIYRESRVADGHGGSTVTETLVETTIGRVESKTVELRTVGGKITLAEKTYVYLPAETDVRPEDIVVCGERFTVKDRPGGGFSGVEWLCCQQFETARPGKRTDAQHRTGTREPGKAAVWHEPQAIQ